MNLIQGEIINKPKRNDDSYLVDENFVDFKIDLVESNLPNNNLPTNGLFSATPNGKQSSSSFDLINTPRNPTYTPPLMARNPHLTIDGGKESTPHHWWWQGIHTLPLTVTRNPHLTIDGKESTPHHWWWQGIHTAPLMMARNPHPIIDGKESTPHHWWQGIHTPPLMTRNPHPTIDGKESTPHHWWKRIHSPPLTARNPHPTIDGKESVRRIIELETFEIENWNLGKVYRELIKTVDFENASKQQN